MATESGRLVALVTHARHVPSVERERFGVGAREWSAHHAGFVLETCHRVEAYAVIHEGEAADARQIPEGGRLHVDEAVVRHAIAVAVGRDSVVVGEDQVLHQLREAVAAAREVAGSAETGSDEVERFENDFSRISKALRLRPNRIAPVAQNVQVSGHPDCEERHSERRPSR